MVPARPDAVSFYRQPAESIRIRGVLQGEHDLEEGISARVTRGMKGYHELLERKLLMRVGVQRYLAHATEQLAETWIAREIGAQGQRVGK